MHPETSETLPLAGSSPQSPLHQNQNKRNDILAILGLLLGLALFFYPALFDGKMFFYRDISSFAYTYKFFQIKTWLQGAMPFWHPLIFSGSPVMELMHTGVFYPLNLVLFVGEFWFAFNLYIILHHCILVFSVYALVRYWGLSVIPASCSAITALLGGYFLSLSSIYNHFQSAIWFPLIFLIFLKYLERGNRRYFIALVALLFCQVLGGSPENFAMSTGTIILYVFANTAKDESFTTNTKQVFIFSIAILLSLGLSALQLIPTNELMAHIIRGEGFSFEASTEMSLNPSALWHFIMPLNFDHFMERVNYGTNYFIPSFYMGLLPIVFAVASLTFILRDKTIRFWLVIFLLGVFFALGKHNPAYQFFFDWVPLVDKFRYPEKYLFLSAFALVFLTGYGVQFLEELANNHSKKHKTFIIFLSLFCLMIFLRGIFFDSREFKVGMTIILIFSGAFFLFSVRKIKKEIFYFILLMLLVADLLMHNMGLIPFVDKAYYTEEPKLISQLPDQTDPYRVYSGPIRGSDGRVSSKNTFPLAKNQLSSMYKFKQRIYPNLSSVYGVPSVDGLTGLDIHENVVWVSVFIYSPDEKRLRILKRSNVKYWVTNENEIGSEGDKPFGLKKIKSFPDALPRAFFVPKARQMAWKKAVNLYYNEAFDPMSEVLLVETPPEVSNDDFQGRVKDIDYYPNGVTLHTEQNSDGFLVLLDSYFPGWSVKIDGKEDHVYRGNFFYRTVKLGPGEHTVEFSFEPVGFRKGCWVSALTVLIFLVILFTPRVRHTILPLHKY